jgi:uncharacterized protein with NRDE domain
MCVAAFAWQAHPRWLLVVAGNRDEFHDRPAAPLKPWDNGILAGQDLRSGGTWLGVSPAGRLALVTNLRGHGGPAPDMASRGELVTDLLTGRARYSDPLTAPLGEFNPFNLLLADAAEAQYLTNKPEELRTSLAHGVYGLSNGMLDEPWPKTLQLKGALVDWLSADTGECGPLFAALASEHLPTVGVPPRAPSDVPREAPETPVFIRDPVYGTRCSTVIAIDRNGRGTIAERRFSAQAVPTGDTTLAFDWPL